MKCMNCGFDNAPQTKNCVNCGAALPVAAKDQKKKLALPKIKLNKKTLTIGACAIVALVLVIVIISAIASASGGYVKDGDQINTIYSAEEDELSVFVNGKLLEDKIDGSIYSSARSMNGSVMALINSDNELYVIKGSKIIEVAKDIVDVKISADGANLVYIEDNGDLFTYKISSGKETEIDDDVVSVSTLSPNGKSFGYIKEDEGYLYNGGKSVKLEDEDQCIVALTNGAKWMFLVDIDDSSKLYVMKKGGESEKLASDVYGSLYFNNDMSELIFRAAGKTYTYLLGKDKSKLDNDSVEPIVPEDCAGYSSFSDLYCYRYGIDTFKGCACIVNNEELTSITRKLEIADDHVDCDSFTVAGDHIIFRDGDELYRVKIGKWDKEVELTDEVVSFVVCDDNKTIYYKNEDGELMYLSGKKNEKIVSDVYSFISYGSNSCLFIANYDGYDNAGKLYITKNGGEKEKLASDAYKLRRLTDEVVYYYVYNEDNGYSDLYFAKNGKDYEKLIEGIN